MTACKTIEGSVREARHRGDVILAHIADVILPQDWLFSKENTLPHPIAEQFAKARADLKAGRLTLEDLEALEQQALGRQRSVRQRLLYLHASSPNIRSRVVAAALHEPVPGQITQIDPLAEENPYESVLAAIQDGWRVIHFPDQRAPFDDREIDIVGYEFILEKLESYDGE
jgi:hypothetical protein